MLTFEGLYTRLQDLTDDDTTATTTLFKALINETHKHICGSRTWSFLEATHTQTLTTGQQIIKLPVNFRKLENFSITVSDIDYYPEYVANTTKFDRINAWGSQVQSDYPVYYGIREKKLKLYPAVSTASLVATTQYIKRPRDMTADDYDTGTITAIANADTTVTGNSTVWTSAMEGRYIKLSDGEWYEIASVESNTELELDIPYEGATIAAGSAAYTIGELPLIPDEYQDLLLYKPLGIYYSVKKGQPQVGQVYYTGEQRQPGMYESMYRDMLREYATKTTTLVQDAPGYRTEIINPNNYPRDIT